jgi:hypothetical protein
VDQDHLEVVLVVVVAQVPEVVPLVEVGRLAEVVEVLLDVVLEVLPEVVLVVVVLLLVHNKERESLMVKAEVLVLSAIQNQRGDSTKLDLNQLPSNHWSRITKVMVVDMTRVTNGTKIHHTNNGAKLSFKMHTINFLHKF